MARVRWRVQADKLTAGGLEWLLPARLPAWTPFVVFIDKPMAFE